jgi:hypothetical protein
MTTISASKEFLRQVANAVAARSASGLALPATGYLVGSPDGAILSEDETQGYSGVDAASFAEVLPTAIGALMLPPSIQDGLHLACGSIGSLASLRTAVPDGLPFLGVLVIAGDDTTSALGASAAASDIPESAYSDVAVSVVADNLAYWREDLRILRGGLRTPEQTHLCVIVAVPVPAAMRGSAPAAEGPRCLNASSAQSFDATFLRAFVFPAGADSGKHDSALAALPVAPVASAAGDWLVFRRSLTVTAPKASSTTAVADYLKHTLATSAAFACISTRALASPKAPASTLAQACVVSAPGFGPVLLPQPRSQAADAAAVAAASQSVASPAALAFTPLTVLSQAGSVGTPAPLILSLSTAVASAPAGAPARACVVELDAWLVLSSALHGTLTLDRVHNRLACVLRDQLSLAQATFASPPVLLHESGLFSRGVAASGLPAYALSVPALTAAESAAAEAAARPGVITTTGPAAKQVWDRVSAWIDPWPQYMPPSARSAMAALEAKRPEFFVPVSYSFRAVEGAAAAGLWAVPPLVHFPAYDYALPVAGATVGMPFSFTPAAEARVAQTAALSELAVVLGDAATVAPASATAGAAAVGDVALPCTREEAAKLIRTALLPGVSDAVSLLPPAALARARTQQLRAAHAWRIGVEAADGGPVVSASVPAEAAEGHSSGRLVSLHASVPVAEAFVAKSPQKQQQKALDLGVDGDSVVYALSTGLSEYAHYLQDGCSDKGWGCAYRALQTVVSWYRLQGYISAEEYPHLRGAGDAAGGRRAFEGVISHRDIQAALVAIGDKPSSLVGSSLWIGAVELSLVLHAVYGIEARILPCANRAAIDDSARALLSHFAHQGTPVMVGGGQLAMCVMGVALNEDTGDVRYLVLDPHYTGSDTSGDAVIKGGWCRWREGSEVWESNSFYNILLPQRPRTLKW